MSQGKKKTKEEYNEYMHNYMRERWHRRRAEAVAIMGGRCVECLSLENLEFDHIDPSGKDFTIGSASAWSEKRLWAELAKCQLLCHDCHVYKHRSMAECGTVQRYWRGCKCRPCKNAFSTYMKEWRDSRK